MSQFENITVIPQLPPTVDCIKIKPAGGFVRNLMTVQNEKFQTETLPNFIILTR